MYQPRRLPRQAVQLVFQRGYNSRYELCLATRSPLRRGLRFDLCRWRSWRTWYLSHIHPKVLCLEGYDRLLYWERTGLFVNGLHVVRAADFCLPWYLFASTLSGHSILAVGDSRELVESARTVLQSCTRGAYDFVHNAYFESPSNTQVDECRSYYDVSAAR